MGTAWDGVGRRGVQEAAGTTDNTRQTGGRSGCWERGMGVKTSVETGA